MSLVLNVEILGEYKDLTRATKGAQGDLKSLDDRIGGFSKSAKAAFLSIGAGLSFAFIARELGDATKAAVEDSKSQALLAKQLETTTGANKSQIASVEKQITKMQSVSAIADDKLRPALAQLTRVTGDSSKALDLLSLATDVSAGSGKSLESVTMALTKAYGGNMGALTKLGIPMSDSIQNASDYSKEMKILGKLQADAANTVGPEHVKAMAKVAEQQDKVNRIAEAGIDWQNDLGKAFSGAAELAGDTDPYARMQVIFGELQEQIGMALLPKLLEFSKWLATPEGAKKLQDITDGIVKILTALVGVVDWVSANGEWLAPLVIGIGAVTAAWQITKGVILAVQTAIGLATVAQKLFNAATNEPQGIGVKGGLGKVGTAVGVLGTVGAVLSLGGSAPLPGTTPSSTKSTSTARTTLTGAKAVSTLPLLGKGATGTTVNVNVKNVTDAKTVIKTVSQFQKSTGTSLAQALR